MSRKKLPNRTHTCRKVLTPFGDSAKQDEGILTFRVSGGIRVRISRRHEEYTTHMPKLPRCHNTIIDEPNFHITVLIEDVGRRELGVGSHSK